MRRWGGVVIALVFGVMPQASHAHELQPGISFGARYDSNIFGRDKDATPIDSDVMFLPSPRVRLSHEEGSLRYNILYRPIYEGFVKFDSNNGWNQFLDARGSWALSPNTSINIFERLADSRSTFIIDPLQTDTGIERRLINTANLSIRHAFTPRSVGSASIAHTLFEFEDPNRSDGQTFNVFLSGSHQLTPRNRVGAGVGAIFQMFDGTDILDSTFNQTYRASLTWLFQYDPTLSLDVSGGPVVIISDLSTPSLMQQRAAFPTRTLDGVTGFVPINSCPRLSLGIQSLEFCSPQSSTLISSPLLVSFPSPNATFDDVAGQTGTVMFVGRTPDKPQNERFTFFGSLAVRKKWSERLTTRLSYSRTQRDTSAQSSSEIVDVVALALTYRPTGRWTLGLGGSWNRRQSATDFAQTLTVVSPSGAGGFDQNGNIRVAAASTGLFLLTSNRAIDISQWRIEGRVRREVSRYVDAMLLVDFVDQIGRGDLQSDTDTRRWRVQLRFTAWLDPLKLF